MPSETDLATGLPWERREELPALVALLGTARLLTFSPSEAFGRLRPARSLVSPLLFGVVVATLAVILNIAGVAIFGSFALFDLPPQVTEVFEITVGERSLEWIPLAAALFTGSFVGMVITLFLFPPVYALGLFAWSAVLHASLSLIGGTRSSESAFRGTFSVAAYSSLAFLVHLIPVVGDLVATLWALALQTIGLAVVHGTGRARALAGIGLAAVASIGGLVLIGLLLG